MSINRVSEKVSQPLVSSFEQSQDRPPNVKDAKSAESVSNAMPSMKDVQGEIEKLNRIVKNYNNKINFDVDQKTNQVVAVGEKAKQMLLQNGFKESEIEYLT